MLAAAGHDLNPGCLTLKGLDTLHCGDGALKRQFTYKGIYSVCKPDGYPVVCFADADGKDGGLFCMPLSEVGGKCV